jgi:hypothetical protein
MELLMILNYMWGVTRDTLTTYLCDIVINFILRNGVENQKKRDEI